MLYLKPSFVFVVLYLILSFVCVFVVLYLILSFVFVLVELYVILSFMLVPFVIFGRMLDSSVSSSGVFIFILYYHLVLP